MKMARSRGYRGRYRRNSSSFAVGLVAMLFLWPVMWIFEEMGEFFEEGYYSKNKKVSK